MLVYSVVSPSVFKLKEFDQPGYRDQVEQFFKALQTNAVLLVDAQGSLLTDIERNVASLPTKYSQSLSIRLEELRKSMKGKHHITNIIKLDADKCRTDLGQTIKHRCSAVLRAASPDAIFLDESDFADAVDSGLDNRAFQMAEYTRSDFEEKRRYYMEYIPAIDQLPDTQFEDLIARSTRFSKWLRLYDKQLGKGTNASNFRRGIECILDIWVRNCHFKPSVCEIYTTESENIFETDSNFTLNEKQKRNQEAIKKFNDLVVIPLSKRFNFEIKAFVKKDPDRLFHARHLQSQTTILQLERGFDFISDGNNLKRAFINIQIGARLHLLECRDLADSELN